eukprot:gene10551-11488_t
MVCGESGVGKTTFCYSIVKKFIEATKKSEFSKSTAKTVEISNVGEFVLQAENNQACIVHVFDSVGYGDMLDNQLAAFKVKDYIVARHRDWLKVKGQETTDEERNQSDTRIHLVFYFFGPHRYKEIDRVFLTELGDVVNIVPIIAKSDTMTVDERREYLKEIRTLLKELQETKGITVYDFEEEIDTEQLIPENDGDFKEKVEDNNLLDRGNDVRNNQEENVNQNINRPLTSDSATRQTDEDSDQVLVEGTSFLHPEKKAVTPPSNVARPELNDASQKEEKTPQKEVLPRIKNVFAVCCDNKTGKRVFPWGTIDTENPDHSDFPRLRSLIFEGGHINLLRELTQKLSNKHKQKGKAFKRYNIDDIPNVIIAFCLAFFAFLCIRNF